MGELLLGKPVANLITEQIREYIEFNCKDSLPKLGIIRVGKDGSDLAYEKGALLRMKKCGIQTEVFALDKDISQNDLIKTMEKANKDKSINGILIFRPLPSEIDEDVVKNSIDPQKDVDCFSPINTAKIFEADITGYNPCTPSAVIEILKYKDIDLEGKNVVILGRSLVVGKPLAMMMLRENATVTICHSRTKNLKSICKGADILVAAVGRAKMVDKGYVKDGAIVIDVGINVDDAGNMCGDVDSDSVIDIVSLITPVPRGVGSVTTSVLAKNTLRAYIRQNMS